jgi:hypothetical protein
VHARIVDSQAEQGLDRRGDARQVAAFVEAACLVQAIAWRVVEGERAVDGGERITQVPGATQQEAREVPPVRIAGVPAIQLLAQRQALCQVICVDAAGDRVRELLPCRFGGTRHRPPV